MTNTSYTSLKGVTEIGDSLLGNQLEHGIIAFFQWGLLGIGGFFNNEDGTNAYGYNPAQLRASEDANFTTETGKSKVWEGRRLDWVWESGVGYANGSPIGISGVTVGGTYYPIETAGNYSHYIDYPLGRVVFGSGIPTTTTVKCNHSSRWASFTTADAEWFKRILTNSNRDQGFGISGSGERAWGGGGRVELPAVAVECVPMRVFQPLQLGGGQILRQDVTFTVIAETVWERNNLIDLITFQSDKTFYIYDLNQVLENDDFPLDYRGMKVNNNQYPDLVGGAYRYKKCRLENMRTQETGIINNYLFGGVVRATIYVEMADLV